MRQEAKQAPFEVTMARLWRPPPFEKNPVALALHRAWLVTFPIGIALMLIAVAAIASGLLHRPALLPVGVVFDMVALALLPTIFRQTLRLWLAVPRGFWTRKGVPVRRNEQPLRFWFWTSIELLALGVPAAAAVFLIVVSGAPG